MITKSGMNPVHPGEVLREELKDIGMSANALARAIDVPVNRVTAILNGDRGITADTALRLARYFDTTAQFWLNLQQTWQIRLAEIGAGTRIRERVIPREAEALQKAARAARRTPGVATPAASALRSIERSLAISDQFHAVERSLRILDANRHMLRALESPLDEIRHAGVFDTVFRSELGLARQWLTDYENRFRLPDVGHVSRLMAELQADSNVTRVGSAFQRSIESMKSPWLDIDNEIGSVQRLYELKGIGELISRHSTFDHAVAENLRDSLGDWRDVITWPEDIWSDLGARVDLYVDLGFDADLTDLPAPAFREITAVADIRTRPPSLVEVYGPPVPPAADSDEETGLVRTNEAHDWLQRLESNLRRFIDSKMTEAFGAEWPRHQLPNKKYEEWVSKKGAATRAGAPSRPLIAYADFTDYVLIICKRDNWDQVFSHFFERPESVRESFQRLHPVRLDTMHARPITQDDEFLLYVETKRLMQRISLASHHVPSG